MPKFCITITFVIFYLLVILETKNIERQIFKCPENKGYYPHFESCDKYWSCINKKATLKACPDGLAFDHHDIINAKSDFAMCRLRQQVKCRYKEIKLPKKSSPSNVDTCPNKFGIHSLGPNCNNFKICRWGLAKIHYCPPTRLFDETTATCIDAPETPALCNFENSGFKCPSNKFSKYPHENYCDKYWRCEYGQAKLEQCPNGLAFRPSSDANFSGGCKYLHEVNCSYRNQLLPPQSSPHCPRANGYFADERFNDIWWYCLSGTAYQSSCDHGYLWDDVVKSCQAKTIPE